MLGPDAFRVIGPDKEHVWFNHVVGGEVDIQRRRECMTPGPAGLGLPMEADVQDGFLMPWYGGTIHHQNAVDDLATQVVVGKGLQVGVGVRPNVRVSRKCHRVPPVSIR